MWAFTVADISWTMRKLAQVIFGEPPKATFQEALDYFLRAEQARPGSYRCAAQTGRDGGRAALGTCRRDNRGLVIIVRSSERPSSGLNSQVLPGLVACRDGIHDTGSFTNKLLLKMVL